MSPGSCTTSEDVVPAAGRGACRHDGWVAGQSERGWPGGPRVSGRTERAAGRGCSPGRCDVWGRVFATGTRSGLYRPDRTRTCAVCGRVLCPATGCGAAWLARLTGGQEVPGSNPGSPTAQRQATVATRWAGDGPADIVELTRRPPAVDLRRSRPRRRTPPIKQVPSTIHCSMPGARPDPPPTTAPAYRLHAARPATLAARGFHLPSSITCVTEHGSGALADAPTGW